MTVSSSVNKVTYSGNSATLVFPVNYYFLENSHLKVILRTADGIENVQVLTTNYTVTGAGNPAGGSVTMLVAPPTGTTLTIVRNVPATQETDYLANDPFPAESHERALDKLTMLVQENEEAIGRALVIPVSTPITVSTTLANPSPFGIFAWNENANAVEYLSPSDIAVNVAYATAYADKFNCNGVNQTFTLSANPVVINNLDVSINGATQVPIVDYTLTNTTLTMTTPPPINSVLLVKYNQNLPNYAGDSQDIRYLPAGSGAEQTTVQTKLRETVSVKDFGAVGDGIADDTAAIQFGVDLINASGGGVLFFPKGTYLLKGKNTPINNNSRLVDGVTLKSNVTFQGVGNASIIKVDVNCANGFTGRFRTAATVGNNLTNIQFRNLQFTRAPTTFYEQNYQLWFDTGTNIIVDSCTFTGWSGDAIIIGNILNSDTSAWLQSICDNIQITNCTFDGVDNNNRQAISVFSGTNINISNNLIKNTTRSDMPGAIDLEPELVTNVIQNISIHDNTFINVGGNFGVVSLALFANLTNKAFNIAVYNNKFFSTVNENVFAVQGISQATDVLPANAPYQIVFENNLCTSNGNALFNISGAENVKISNNFFGSSSKVSYISYYTGSYLQTRKLFITNNAFVDCRVNYTSDSGQPLISVHGTLIGGSISNNSFINCSIYNTSTSSNGVMQVFGFDGFGNSLTSSYLNISDNFVNNYGVSFVSGPVFFTSGTLTNASTIAMNNNRYLGYTEIGDANSIFTQAESQLNNGSVYFYPQGAAPSNPKAGQVYFDATVPGLFLYNGIAWVAL